MGDRIANIQALCDKLGVKNPIEEKVLRYRTFVFEVNGEEFPVDASDSNRAGRLFLQAKLDEQGMRSFLVLDDEVKAEASRFFTDELWDDCSAQRRTLVWAIKNGSCAIARPK